MPTHPLDDAFAKVAWARLHFEELKRVADEYAALHRYATPLENDPKTGELVAVARAVVPDEPIPASIPMLTGDIVNNLRSALNYLVWQLALRRGRTHDQIQFPIVFDDARKPDVKPARDRWDDAVRRFHLNLVGETALRTIEGMQPYNGNHWETLGHLALLNDLDKHRLPVVQVQYATIRGGGPKLIGFPKGRIPIAIRAFLNVSDGTELCRFVGLRMRPKPSMKVEFDLSTSIFVGETEKAMVGLNYLFHAVKLVPRILRVFRDTLEPAHTEPPFG